MAEQASEPLEAFRQEMAAGYAPAGLSVILGSPMRGAEIVSGVRVQVGLPMTNRHGLIAGATGTGKTKTLQIMAGQLSEVGVPVFVSDIKGDVTGIGAPGDAANPQVRERSESLDWPFQPLAHPIELLSLSGKLGAQVRASVHSFGPTLLGKVLDLNETQTSVLSLIFKYCDDNALPLLDLADLQTTLKFLGSEEGRPILDEYGGMSKATVGVILRSLITLEQEGADVFFGEPEFDVRDLMRQTPEGKGLVTLLELSDVMDQPRLFSTFMLWMLAQLYESLPEAGDLPQPKLCFFFDEAHLLFDDASDALMDQVELTVRLIRSKGVGVYFVTQSPTDVPSSVLAQLGNRVQHALRAFTPDDAENLRKTARTFPTTDFYDVEETITSLGIGEALVTVLSPKGVPTPLAATRLIPPDSQMAPLTPERMGEVLAASPLKAKYGTPVDRQSAHEMITARIGAARAASVPPAGTPTPAATPAPAGIPTAEGGLNTMTPAQQRAEIRRQAAEQKRLEREAARQRAQMEKAERDEERARQRQREMVVRESSRVARSRAGQDILRSVLGVLLGGRR